MIVKLSRILFIFLLFILLIDPSDRIFHIKLVLFFLVFFVWIINKIITKKNISFNKDAAFISFFFLLIPVVGIISGIIQNTIADADFAAGIVKSFSIFILINFIIDTKIPIYEYFNWVSLSIPLLIIPIYFTYLINPVYFKNIGLYLVDAKDEAAFDVRNFYGFTVVMIYYKTSALLVFPLAYFLYRFMLNRRFMYLLLSVICFAALFLSGTRGNIIAAFIVVVYLFFNHIIVNKKIIVLFISILFTIYAGFVFISNLSFDDKDTSQDIKAGHMQSYIQLFKDKPLTLLFGEGPGSKFFSKGLNANILQSELTYLDLVRMFGIPLTIILLAILAYPLLYLSKNKLSNKHKDAVIAYYAYLFIVGTNPLLISSTGVVAVIIMYSFIQKDRLPYNTAIGQLNQV